MITRHRTREPENAIAKEALLHGEACMKKRDYAKACAWFLKASREGSKYAISKYDEALKLLHMPSLTKHEIRAYHQRLEETNKKTEAPTIAPSISIPNEEQPILVEVLTPGKPAEGKQPQATKQKAEKNGNNTAESAKKTNRITALVTRADNGDTDAQFELGQHYEKKGSIKQANQWYQKASERGHMDAKFRLGVLYLQKAIKLFQDAAEQNHVQAVEELDRLTRPGATLIPDSVLQHMWMHDADEDERFRISRINRQTHKTGISYPAVTSYQKQDFSANEIVAEKEAQEADNEEDVDILSVWMERHSSMEGSEGICIVDGATGNHEAIVDTDIWTEEEEEECAETESSGHVKVESEQHNIELSNSPPAPVSGCICCPLIHGIKNLFSQLFHGIKNLFSQLFKH